MQRGLIGVAYPVVNALPLSARGEIGRPDSAELGGNSGRFGSKTLMLAWFGGARKSGMATHIRKLSRPTPPPPSIPPPLQNPS